MSAHRRTAPGGTSPGSGSATGGRSRRARRWVPAALAVLGLLGLVCAAPVRAQGVSPSTTSPPASGGSSSGGAGSGASGSGSSSSGGGSSQPSGQVAYVTADGRVWVGDGAGTPEEVAQGAATGRAQQAAVAISPDADLLAFIRYDGALVTVPLTGGPQTVLATDAVTSSLGINPSLAWNPVGDQIAYLARGTEEMVPPASALEPPISDGAYRVPMPQGVLGNVVKIIDRAGTLVNRVGDPSTRSMTGVTWSPADDIMVLDSVIPGTDQPYTLVVATSGSAEATPSVLSADDPAFAPDGRFLLAVGPSKGSKEMLRIALDTLDISRLVTDDDICNPVVSPDGLRIAYGGGPNCSRLKVISATGGRAVDVTPAETPDTATFGVGQIGWTVEGRYITHANCRADAGAMRCDGPVMFLDPDTGREESGPDAPTVAPIARPLVQDVWLDIDLRGPLQFRHSFVLDAEVQGQLTDTEENGGQLTGRLSDGGTVLSARLQMNEGEPLVTGTITIKDPEGGIDRTFMVLARALVLGVRVFSMSGVWITTNDLPFASGEFNMAVRRR